MNGLPFGCEFQGLVHWQTYMRAFLIYARRIRFTGYPKTCKTCILVAAAYSNSLQTKCNCNFIRRHVRELKINDVSNIKKRDNHLQNRMAIRVPRNRAIPNPNPWPTWCKLIPAPLPVSPGKPVPVVVSVVEGGRTTDWEGVLTVVAGVGVTTPGGVATTVVRVVGVVGGVTTGRVVVGPTGVTLSVTGVRPNPSQTSWNVSTRPWAAAMVSVEGVPVKAQLTQFCKPTWTEDTQRHAAVVHLSKAALKTAHAVVHVSPCRTFKN